MKAEVIVRIPLLTQDARTFWVKISAL